MPGEVACQVSGPSMRSRPPPCGSESSARGCDPYSGNTAGAPGGGGMWNHWLRPASGQSGTESHVHLPALNVMSSQALSPACLPPRPTPLPHLWAEGSHSATQLPDCRVRTMDVPHPMISLLNPANFSRLLRSQACWGLGGHMARRRTSSSQMYSGRGHLVKTCHVPMDDRGFAHFTRLIS